MIPIIVAIFLAVSAVGGGVVVVAHEAPSSSPLHVVAVKSDAVFNSAQLPANNSTASPTASSTASPTASPTAQLTSTPTPELTATSTPAVTASPTLQATATEPNDDSDMHGQEWRGLVAKLDAAKMAYERGNTQAAINILGAFHNQLDAMLRSDGITQADYDALNAKYNAIIARLNGTPTATVTVGATPTEEVEATATEGPEKHGHKSKADDDYQVTATGTPQASTSVPDEGDGHSKTGAGNREGSGNHGDYNSSGSRGHGSQHGSKGGNGNNS